MQKITFLVVGKIKSNFNKQNGSMYDTGFNFVDATIFDNTGMNELSAGLGDLTSGSIDYPAMIFDGPFSTALETKIVLNRYVVTQNKYPIIHISKKEDSLTTFLPVNH